MSRAKKYSGQKISITFAASRCIHAAECGRGLPAVFDSSRKPWVDPDAATVEDIARVVNRCPTGALNFKASDRSVFEIPDEEASVVVCADGPLYIRGDLTITDADDNIVHEGTRVALCRCGATKNKPFCDGSHTEAGFSDACELSADTDVNQSTGNALDIKCAANGPLVLNGSVAIRSGEAAVSRDKAALCRCGGSGNKPFCDGTHKKIGFSA